MTKEQKENIQKQSMCYADVSSAYYLGKQFALKYGSQVLGTSSTPFGAKQAKNRLQNQLGVKGIKVVPLEKVVQDHRTLDAEVQRITDLLNPVNDSEMEAVKEVALDNLMKKAVIEAIPWGTLVR
jgi:hypothetical protein